MAAQRPEPWKTEEDILLLELVEAGKSWVLISAKLKRSIKHVQVRHRLLKRRSRMGDPDLR
jgi:predicted nucleotidyltransferase